MKRPAIKRGYKAVKEEEERREQARKESRGKLWRVFFPKNADEDYEIPIRFLTNEPICYHEHNIMVAGKFENHFCTGEDCPYCKDGDKPRFVGAFLVIDRTEFEVDEKDSKGKPTGKKKTVRDKVKLLVRGTTDLAKLERLDKKYGLLDRDWNVYKTGNDTTTTWNFDRGDKEKMSKKEIQNILPENLRDQDFYDIVTSQVQGIFDDEDDEEEDDYEDDEEDINDGVIGLDDDEEEDEEEDTPPRRTGKHINSSRTSSRNSARKGSPSRTRRRR